MTIIIIIIIVIIIYFLIFNFFPSAALAGDGGAHRAPTALAYTQN